MEDTCFVRAGRVNQSIQQVVENLIRDSGCRMVTELASQLFDELLVGNGQVENHASECGNRGIDIQG